MAFPRTSVRRCRLILAALVLGISVGASGQDDVQDEQPYLPGLIATFRDREGRQVQRIEDSFRAMGESPADMRLREVEEAHWNGLLLAQGAGEYRLHLFGTAAVRVRLAGKDLKFNEAENGWRTSEPVTLSFDYHPLEVHSSRSDRDARWSIFWSGPQFGVEPIAPRYLWHDRNEKVETDFVRGRMLNQALRCTACHAPVLDKSLVSAPSLAGLSGNLERKWLIERLMQNGQLKHQPSQESDGDLGPSSHRRMPFYGLPRDEAEAIAAFLLTGHKSPAKAPKTDSPSPGESPSKRPLKAEGAKKSAQETAPSISIGERLFLTLGCLACHQRGELGESGLFGGGDLTNVAAKRPPDFFLRWLSDPVAIQPKHRMPTFLLTADERISLSMYLAGAESKSLLQRASDRAQDRASHSDQIERGSELVQKLRCGNCHELPGAHGALRAGERQWTLGTDSAWDRSCAGVRMSAKSGWGYDLPAEYQKWLQAYLVRAPSTPEPQFEAEHSILHKNCLACHAREGFSVYAPFLPAPLADKLAAVGQQHDELAALIPAMTPPSLNGVGDKLKPSALAEAIRRTGPPHRSYLLVQMPKFEMGQGEESALVGYFPTMDQIPPGAPQKRPQTEGNDSVLAAAGGRLVSTDGFGCVSCHQIGSVVPDKAPLNARGPGLARIDSRIRREWFDRFVADPSRIVPRMEMPSVRIPVKGVLQDNVATQLAAVWHVLSQPGFEPPEPNPVRVLRLSGIAGRNEPPIVVHDVVKVANLQDSAEPTRTFIQPLMIGLHNRQNFLYDLDEGRLAAWWLGDTARQRTKGKSWHWELGGPIVMSAMSRSPELAILRNGKKLVPLRLEQHVAELRGYQIVDERVKLSYLLQLGNPDDPRAAVVPMTVSEVWRPGTSDAGPQVLRDLYVRWNAVNGDQLICELAPADLAAPSEILPDQERVRLKDGAVHLMGERGLWSLAPDGRATSKPIAASKASAHLRLAYRSLIAPDTIDLTPLSFPADADVIEVAPGFSGRRLPLPGDIMPTALAWRSGVASRLPQRLVVGSLKGEVIAASDTNGDGLEDATVVLADGLATPYGIQDSDDGLHVLTKDALLEVRDGAVTVLAAGWGHTDDYHDWAVGLPRNDRGEYFLGLPCQQDQRGTAAAKYRGSVLKLTPRASSEAHSARYDVQVVSTGHRFPMGMALNRDGELFVTDNQGNYNPFNELNHVRQGAFFGFVNANQKKDQGFQAPVRTDPAIDIPHPWTRSVNGICFLDTPAHLSARGGESLFGPLEGHLVGCEYDTRRLVRMTLQKVGDTYQGAAYPLSLEPSSPEKGFLGPVVCAVSPHGELYVGSIRDSGWGAGNNIGEVVQIKIEPEKLPAGIAEVRANSAGFVVEFFRPVDASRATNVANYLVSSYRRESTPAYGGPDLDRRIEKISQVEVSADRRRATIALAELREGFVYEFQLKNLTGGGELFYPSEAHYTLRKIP